MNKDTQWKNHLQIDSFFHANNIFLGNIIEK